MPQDLLCRPLHKVLKQAGFPDTAYRKTHGLVEAPASLAALGLAAYQQQGYPCRIPVPNSAFFPLTALFHHEKHVFWSLPRSHAFLSPSLCRPSHLFCIVTSSLTFTHLTLAIRLIFTSHTKTTSWTRCSLSSTRYYRIFPHHNRRHASARSILNGLPLSPRCFLQDAFHLSNPPNQTSKYATRR